MILTIITGLASWIYFNDYRIAILVAFISFGITVAIKLFFVTREETNIKNLKIRSDDSFKQAFASNYKTHGRGNRPIYEFHEVNGFLYKTTKNGAIAPRHPNKIVYPYIVDGPYCSKCKIPVKITERADWRNITLFFVCEKCEDSGTLDKTHAELLRKAAVVLDVPIDKVDHSHLYR